MTPAAFALTAGGAVTATSTSAVPAPVVDEPAPQGFGHGGHGRPLHFGPFEFPRYGSLSGGFSWGARD
ncbi:hypothetical protein ACIF8T_18850 [Streptomyces sp. NPDC085946]|uniref:hypothetical protein n=1 Tax=Streptomyces sp. NPDC085946 TaxID=3365744 RepID=UPI0037CE1DA5